VPRYGLPGALVATFASNVLATAWFLIRFGRVTGWGFASVFLRPTLQPLAVLAVVSALGKSFATRLPHGAGLAGWFWALVAASLPALGALVLLFATGFLPIAELRALLRRPPVARAPEA
jgi:hypothetical protein